MWIRTWNFGKILAVTGALGALVALGISFAVRSQYVSEAVLEVTLQYPLAGGAPAREQAVTEYIAHLAQRVEGRATLASEIDIGLYPGDRAKMVEGHVIEMIRRRISIRPVRGAGNGNASETAFSIQFASDDPARAQKATRYLVTQFIDENVRGTSGIGPSLLRLRNPASLPSHPTLPARPFIIVSGLAAGLAMGAIFAGLQAYSAKRACLM
jgi:hypothetical protein